MPSPVINSIIPPNVSSCGNTPLQIDGQNFNNPPVSLVTIDGASVQFNIFNDMVIECMAPKHAPGQVTLAVSNAIGTAQIQLNYFDGHPQILPNLAPSSGPANGGTQVFINGSNLNNVLAVLFDSSAGQNVLPNPPNQVSAYSPPHPPGTVNVAVVTDCGTSNSVPFTYSPCQPTLNPPVSPNNGPVAGGTPVDIHGTNFTTSSQVMFGSQCATNVVFHSSSWITATSPPQMAGTVNVTVSNACGTSNSAPFTYI